MKTAAVIVNWNSGDFLLNCVRSILEQTRPADHILVIDNASTDHSLSTLSELSADALELMTLPDNLGFAAANNLAIQRLQGYDWVALLNPDAVAAPDWLEKLLSAVERYPVSRSFASRMITMDDVGVLDGAGDCYHFSGVVWRRFHGLKLQNVPKLEDAPVFGACGGAAFYHRESFLKLGGFDEHYFCYCEDVDLAFRMQLAGMQCQYIDQAMVVHKGGGTTGDSTEFADYHGHRNLVWTWVKNMPWPLLVLLLPAHILANLLMLAVSTTQGRGGVILGAKIDALKGLSVPLSQRALVHSERRISLWKLWRLMDKSLWRK